MKSNNLFDMPAYNVQTEAGALDNFKNFGHLYCYGEAAPFGVEGNVFIFPNPRGGATQIRIAYNNSSRCLRTYNWSSKSWTNWVEI